MFHDFSFPAVLATSVRAAWQIEDVLPAGAKLDFARNFLPEALAGTAAAHGLTDDEKRTLNQIRGHEYLSIFGIVEEFILPFLIDHARPQLSGDDHRVRALLQFAGEEAKHIHLFKLFHERFVEGFGSECEVIGPAQAIGAEVLRHDPLAVALAILQIEWMTQAHYVDSVRGNDEIDPLFASLLKHHWIEESQHAKLDTLIVEALVEMRDNDAIAAAIDGYLEIVRFIDGGLEGQVELNLAALERAIGRSLAQPQRSHLAAQQHQALRRTYIGSGMTHPRFLATLNAISPNVRDRIAAIAPTFC